MQLLGYLLQPKDLLLRGISCWLPRQFVWRFDKRLRVVEARLPSNRSAFGRILLYPLGSPGDSAILGQLPDGIGLSVFSEIMVCLLNSYALNIRQLCQNVGDRMD